MSSTARWIIAGFSLFCAVSFAVMAFISPLEPTGIIGWFVVLLFPLFCLAITVVCFPSRFGSIAARFIGGCVFALSIVYIVSEIGKPLPTLSNYRRSDTNIINALFFFIIFGLPAGYVAFAGLLEKIIGKQKVKQIEIKTKGGVEHRSAKW